MPKAESVEGRSGAFERLQGIYGPVVRDLQEVDRRIREHMDSEKGFEPLLKHVSRFRGKMLRPAVLLLVGSRFGELTDVHYELAASVEMIHSATLVHDDILDEARTRRGGPTVNARWDNETAVLLGDFLFARAFTIASKGDKKALEILAEAAALTARGEIMQVLCRGNFGIDESKYLELVGLKTAALVEAAGELGAWCSGITDEKLLKAIGGYCRNVGLAFQIVDDTLDLVGDEKVVGKTLGTDASLGKATLPVIYALEQADEVDRKRLMDSFGSDDEAARVEADRVIRRLGAHELALAKARELIDEAVDSLEPLKGSEAHKSLVSLAGFVIDREM